MQSIRPPPTVPAPIGGEALRTDDAPARPGRPLAITPKKRERLLYGLRNGMTQKWSARFAGVAVSTLCRYLADGREQRLAAQELDPEAVPAPGTCWELLEAVEDNRSAFVAKLVGRMNKMSRAGSERATEYLLGVIDPPTFRANAQSRVELTGSKGGPVKVDAQFRTGVVVMPPYGNADEPDEEPTP